MRSADTLAPLSRRTFIAAMLAFAPPALAKGQGGQPPAADPLLVIGGHVLDPAGTSGPRRADVLIRGERILAVGQGLDVPRGAGRVDAAGQFLLPGLWDMHAHVAAVGETGDALVDYVAHGVLGIRDMGGRAADVFRLREAVRSGRAAGPMMLIAGPTLNGERTAEHHRLVRDAAEARAAVRELARAGVDFLKIHRRVSREAFFAIGDESRRQRLQLAGHAPLALDWVEAANSGMASIEHIQTLVENEIRGGDDPVRATGEAIDRLLGGRADEIFAAMARNRTHWTPTLIFYERSWENDPPARRALKQAAYARLTPLVRRAAAAGVPILAGTDLFRERGAAVWDELDRLVRAGLTPRHAVAAATVTASALARRGPGPIRAGEEASFLVLRANPFEDIANIRTIAQVALRGRVVSAA